MLSLPAYLQARPHLRVVSDFEHGRPEVVLNGDLEVVSCEVQHLLGRGMAVIHKPQVLQTVF